MDTREITLLHARIEQLLKLVADLQAEAGKARRIGVANEVVTELATEVPTAVTAALEGRVLQLREANQSLVLATFDARDGQATAEAANLRQTQFLALLAHELRTPLQPISVANALLAQLSRQHPELSNLQGIIGRQLQSMVRLVDDLLDASRISSGNITLQKRPFALSDMIAAALESSASLIEQRQQQVHLELPLEAIVIDGDLMRLAQVFSNLLLNASKFSSPNDHITIRAKQLQQTVAVSVIDHGAGIAAHLQPFIFDLFTQGAATLERSRGGLGIGLSLVRMLVHLHQGQVAVFSQGSGLGSTLTVTLPLLVAANEF